MTDRDAVHFLEIGALLVGALVLFVHLVLAVGLAVAAGLIVIACLVWSGLRRTP